MKPRLYIRKIDPALKADEETFSTYRLEWLKNARSLRRRAEGINAERLLIHALRDTIPETPLPLRIKTGEHGKPELEGSALRFSLSHSGDYCVCAVSDAEIGADIQRLVPPDMRVVERCFSAAEREYVLRAADRSAAFTRIWAMKESLLKLGGSGILVPLASACSLTAMERFVTGEHDGHIYAVCVPCGGSADADIIIIIE